MADQEGNQKICRMCLLQETDPNKYKTEIVHYIEKLHEKDRASKEEYEKRLEICKSCDKLAGGTCLGCGCYVELRAAAIHAKCPKRKW